MAFLATSVVHSVKSLRSGTSGGLMTEDLHGVELLSGDSLAGGRIGELDRPGSSFVGHSSGDNTRVVRVRILEE